VVEQSATPVSVYLKVGWLESASIVFAGIFVGGVSAVVDVSERVWMPDTRCGVVRVAAGRLGR
jgi:hypothetical protein